MLLAANYHLLKDTILDCILFDLTNIHLALKFQLLCDTLYVGFSDALMSSLEGGEFLQHRLRRSAFAQGLIRKILANG